MTRYKDRAAELKEELNEALNDERYRNPSFVSVGNLTRGNRSYLTRHMEKSVEFNTDTTFACACGELSTVPPPYFIEKCRRESHAPISRIRTGDRTALWSNLYGGSHAKTPPTAI